MSTKEEVRRKYHKPPQPDCKPMFPKRVSDLSNEELMDLYGDFTQWEVFAVSEVGELDYDRTIAENAYKRLKAKKMFEAMEDIKEELGGKTKDMKKYDVEGRVESDSEVAEAKKKWNELDARYKLERSYLDAYSRNTAALSRDLTRRKISLDHESRDVDSPSERSSEKPFSRRPYREDTGSEDRIFSFDGMDENDD